MMDNSPTSYMQAGASSGMPLSLGAPVPGATGGLPAAGGLSALQNPMAQELQSKGRGRDTMLVHMTPEEVGGLQQLALASGGSLTVNPDTGLPEAGWLGKLLPTIAGALLSFTPLAPVAPLLVGAATGIAKGDLGAGLMAGLQAWGGGSLAGMAKGLGGAASAASAATQAAQPVAASQFPGLGAQPFSGLGASAAQPVAAVSQFPGLGAQPFSGLGATTAQGVAQALPIASSVQAAAPVAPPGMFSQFADASRTMLPKGAPGVVQKYAPYAAGLGLMSALSDASQPNFQLPPEARQTSTYRGPYVPQPRTLRMPTKEERETLGSGEWDYFTPSNPVPGYRPASSLSPEERRQYGYAEGGDVASPPAPTAGSAQPDLSQYGSLFGGYGSLASQAGSFGGFRPLGGYAGLSPFMTLLNNYGGYSPPRSRSGIYADPSMTMDTGGLRALFAPIPRSYVFGRPRPTAPEITPATMQSVMSNTGYTPAPAAQGPVPIPPETPTITAPTTSAPVTPAPAPARQLGYMERYPDVAAEYARQSASAKGQKELTKLGVDSPAEFAQFHYNTFGQSEGRVAPDMGVASALDAPAPEAPAYDPYTDYGYGFRAGGNVSMQDGSFVIDARTVSELGNGSSNAGRELLARMGGRPVDGRGDGVSDSVPARIGGVQRARVARDEVIMPPEVVRRLGKGNSKRGSDKLYAMMDRAHSARKNAKRGQDTGLRRGLG